MSPNHPDYYPPYTPPERVADGTMHLVGVVGSILGTMMLISIVLSTGSIDKIMAAWIYALCMIFAFCASAAYHFTPVEHFRPLFRRMDHAGIFLKIAGTYTPLVVIIGTGFSYFILGVVWATALFGVVWKLFYWSTPNWRSTLLYLALGWLSLALVWPLFQTMPPYCVALVILGGLTYTIGVIFYRWDTLRYSVAIWHGFVLAASSCFYFAIYYSQTGLPNLF
ncbi:DNA-binding protein [Amylibacter marinus]|uniref:DNA-binding protein n=2 Tax=Amylibacter marinus TaxID=1475483 RepID=A0ABQ5VR30_9RHOB|nr:DNA-binding protein [Amylibacter marinus]